MEKMTNALKYAGSAVLGLLLGTGIVVVYFGLLFLAAGTGAAR